MDIHNGKCHVLLVPHPGSTTPHKIEFPGDDREFDVFWGEKKRKCSLVHMLKVQCEGVKRNRGKVGKNVTADLSPVVLECATTLSQPQNHSSEDKRKNENDVHKMWLCVQNLWIRDLLPH